VGDVAHRFGAGVGGEHAAHQVEGDDDRGEAGGEGEEQPRLLGPSEDERLVATRVARDQMWVQHFSLYSGRQEVSRDRRPSSSPPPRRGQDTFLVLGAWPVFDGAVRQAARSWPSRPPGPRSGGGGP